MEAIDKIVLKTRNFVTIHNACNDALNSQKMIAIVAPTGYGKTTGLVTFAMSYPKRVIYLKAAKSATPSIFYKEIFSAITGKELRYIRGEKYYVIRDAAYDFIQREEPMLLIIDEANKFSPSMLEYLHEVRDLIRENTGIILSGTMEFQTNLVNWKTKGKSGIPEFFGRINYFQELFPPDFDEIVAIIRAYDIYDRQFESKCKIISSFRELTNEVKNYKTIRDKKPQFIDS